MNIAGLGLTLTAGKSGKGCGLLSTVTQRGSNQCCSIQPHYFILSSNTHCLNTQSLDFTQQLSGYKIFSRVTPHPQKIGVWEFIQVCPWATKRDTEATNRDTRGHIERHKANIRPHTDTGGHLETWRPPRLTTCTRDTGVQLYQALENKH